MKKRIITIIIIIILCILAVGTGYVLQTKFNIADTSIDEKTSDEKEYPANVEMDYLEQKGVKIKVDYVSISDGNFEIVFNFSMEEGISNYEGIFLSGLLIVDEEENVIYKDTEENGVSLTEVMEAKPIYKDENTIRQLILLISEEFPQSKQLDITFNKIKLYNVNQGNPIENDIEGNWNLKIEV